VIRSHNSLEKEGKTMKIFLWIAFLILVAIAIFAVQNSSASPVIIKFLIWKFETSLVYTILGSIVLGIFLTLLFWVQRAIGASLRRRELNRANRSGPP
jgi:putative membrane protein